MKERKRNSRTTLIITLCLLSSLIMLGLYTYRQYETELEMWKPTFVNNETKPFDTYICYQLLQTLNGKEKIISTRQPIYNNLKDSLENYFYYEDDSNYIQESTSTDEAPDESEEIESDTDTIAASTDPMSIYNDIIINDTIAYIFINKVFTLEPADKNYLLDFVGIGNNVFISAEQIDYQLLTELTLETNSNLVSADTTYYMNDDKDQKYNIKAILANTTLNVDSCKYPIRILARNNQDKPVFVQIRYGKGCFFLHTIPNAFTNYTLIKKSKYEFAFRCLSYIPASNNILWDEYQTQGPINSIFKELTRKTPLKMALIITVFGFLIFIIFRAKREQRVIPIIKPPVNSSVEFLDTISNLYYRKKDFRIIADKRQAYFLDYIRRNYYISTENIDEEFINNLNTKSTFDKDKLKHLFSLYSEIQRYYSISNTTFLEYNNLLEEFYRTVKTNK